MIDNHNLGRLADYKGWMEPHERNASSYAFMFRMARDCKDAWPEMAQEAKEGFLSIKKRQHV